MQNPNWKVLDIGCGYTAHERADVVADTQNFENYYKDKKKFILIKEKKLPFKDKEFDFKNTLFLPDTNFPMRASLPTKEPDWLEHWNMLNFN